MKQETYKKIELELADIWDSERSIKFLDQIEKKLDLDQFECLGKMIPYIIEETPQLDEKTLEEITKNLDTFDGSLEFLEYFFKMTQPELVEDIMKNLKADKEEVIDLLETMEDQGIIQYLVEFDSFYVWFR
ncbi:MAG: hypothetical protein DSY38_02725 [Fusobacteria bacterium]|nr:MAG: hypothetical protein DSY38_02725 [Fusobacteriota bacterium]